MVWKPGLAYWVSLRPSDWLSQNHFVQFKPFCFKCFDTVNPESFPQHGYVCEPKNRHIWIPVPNGPVWDQRESIKTAPKRKNR